MFSIVLCVIGIVQRKAIRDNLLLLLLVCV